MPAPLAPTTPILARTRYVREVDRLSEAGANVVVAEEFEGSIELVARALESFDIPTGAIARFTEALREEGYGAIRAPASRQGARRGLSSSLIALSGSGGASSSPFDRGR